MFKRLMIVLASPICKHEQNTRNLAWSIVTDNGGHGLRVACEQCGAVLRVPKPEFVANFTLELTEPGANPEEDGSVRKESERRGQPVTHSREFTPFDRKFLSKWGIKEDEESS